MVLKSKQFLCLFLTTMFTFSIPLSVFAQQTYDHTEIAPTETGFIKSDGVDIEYAVYGSPSSEPMLLLSPNNGDMHAFDTSLVPELSKKFYVITFSTRGTGKTAHGPVKLTFERDSEDIINILDFLKINSVNVYGFSDGGNLGLVFTLLYPERVRRLAIKGANINTSGTKLFSQLGYDSKYVLLSIEYYFNHDEDTLRRRDITGKMVGQPTLKFSDLNNITCPTLNIYGEHDMFYRWHSQMITKSIPGATELMIKGSGHSISIEDTDKILLPALFEFYGDGTVITKTA